MAPPVPTTGIESSSRESGTSLGLALGLALEIDWQQSFMKTGRTRSWYSFTLHSIMSTFACWELNLLAKTEEIACRNLVHKLHGEDD